MAEGLLVDSHCVIAGQTFLAIAGGSAEGMQLLFHTDESELLSWPVMLPNGVILSASSTDGVVLASVHSKESVRRAVGEVNGNCMAPLAISQPDGTTRVWLGTEKEIVEYGYTCGSCRALGTLRKIRRFPLGEQFPLGGFRGSDDMPVFVLGRSIPNQARVSYAYLQDGQVECSLTPHPSPLMPGRQFLRGRFFQDDSGGYFVRRGNNGAISLGELGGGSSSYGVCETYDEAGISQFSLLPHNSEPKLGSASDRRYVRMSPDRNEYLWWSGNGLYKGHLREGIPAPVPGLETEGTFGSDSTQTGPLVCGPGGGITFRMSANNDYMQLLFITITDVHDRTQDI